MIYRNAARRTIAPEMQSKQMSQASKPPIAAVAPKRAAAHLKPWDECDPVANALLDLIEAQNALQSLIDATCEERDDGTFATFKEIDAALVARRSDAMMNLLAQTLQPPIDPCWEAGTY